MRVPDVCAVIVCRDAGRWLDGSLVNLYERAGPADLEVLVVDAGEYGVAEYLGERFPAVRTIRAGGGEGEVRNRALGSTEARYVLFLDPEVEVVEGSLTQLVSALDTFPGIGVASVRQLDGEGSLLHSIGRFPSISRTLAEALGIARLPGARRFLSELASAHREYDLPRTCDWVSGSFMFVRRDALEDVGWFDERFPRLGEVDLCRRLKRAEWETVYLPCTTVRCRRGTGEEGDGEVEAAYAQMQFARKHFPAFAGEYRWALALRYALQVGAYSGLRRYRRRRDAARAALSTVLKGHPPLGERSPA